MPHFAAARDRMVRRQLWRRGIRDPILLEAFRRVARELFVEPEHMGRAYDDAALPIAAGQTVSQPYIVARMIEAAGVRPRMQVLEVGAGSGYAAAVMGCFFARVVAIERHETLARLATSRIAQLGYDHVRIVHGDGCEGFAEAAPFDAIIVSAAAPEVPPALPRQLRVGGTLVMPVGWSEDTQHLVRISRTDAGFTREELEGVRFVPLVSGTPGKRRATRTT